MKEIVKTTIKQNKKVADNVYHLILELPYNYPKSDPGQFVNLYLNNQAKILPRPISIFDHQKSDATGQELHLVYAVVGEGTEELSRYKTGTKLRLSTPLGNGFQIPDYNILAEKVDEKIMSNSDITNNVEIIEDIDNYDSNHYNVLNDDIVLIGGGLGIAPIHYLARTIYKKYKDTSKRPNVYAILGYADEPFLAENIAKYCDEIQICSEKKHDECWQGTVMLPLEECEYYMMKNWFTCGPYPMQKALSEYAKSVDNSSLQVSLEERMGCGFGICVGCNIDIKDTNTNSIIRKKVCKDGPVFYGSEVVW